MVECQWIVSFRRIYGLTGWKWSCDELWIHNLLACELTDRGVPNVTNKQTQEVNELDETVII